MSPRSASKTKRNTSRSAGPNHALMARPAVPDTGSKGGQDLNRFSIKGSNYVYPVAPIVVSTGGYENTPRANAPRSNTAASSQNYVVKVRVLHGIDLYIPSANTPCQHASRPVVGVAVNDSTVQSCAAARHARNHSIWKKHELKFRISDKDQSPTHPVVDGEVNGPSSFISMYVSLTCTTCSCTAKTHDKGPNSVAIGEVGEVQFPTKQNEDYEISRFFPVIRRQQHYSPSTYALFPAGKIKLCIRVEVEKSAPVAQPEIPKRPPFALPTNFGEALQLKRKQLKATIVPEDISQKMSNQQVSLVDSGASAELLKEITAETARDQIDAGELKVDGRIGEGIHSCVSLGILRRGNNDSSWQVAVKEFRHQHAFPPVNVLRAFQQEYRILERCRSQNGHQHVVELLGVILEPRLVILMEYFSHGSLAQCLQDERAWGRMSCKQKTALGLKIAQDIAWLHKHDVIHRDIKTHNLLIDDELATPSPAVKIGDLGSAVVRLQHEPPLLEEVGSSGYTAPEIFTHHGYDSKVDVWSFGIVLWELTSSSPQDRVNPFTGMAGEEFVIKAQSGCRPNLIHTHQLCIKHVVEKCWRFDPSQRPNMDEVVNQLEAICCEL